MNCTKHFLSEKNYFLRQESNFHGRKVSLWGIRAFHFECYLNFYSEGWLGESS